MNRKLATLRREKRMRREDLSSLILNTTSSCLSGLPPLRSELRRRFNEISRAELRRWVANGLRVE